MKKISIKLFVISLLLLELPSLTAQKYVSPYEPAVVKSFADSLFEEGFLTEAEGEYKRYLFSFSQTGFTVPASTPDFQSSLISLCNIYNIQQNKTGAQWLDENFYKFAQPAAREKISNLNAEFIFKERNILDLYVLSYKVEKTRESFSPDFLSLLQVSELLLNKDFQGLKELTPVISTDNEIFSHLNELSLSYKTKSPGLALFLSMILPGCGRWYTGSFAAFTSSFISIGSFVAGTVLTGLKTEWKSWQPYVFGSCALVLYITDLYGSYKSAQRYNDALYRHMCEETEKIYGKLY